MGTCWPRPMAQYKSSSVSAAAHFRLAGPTGWGARAQAHPSHLAARRSPGSTAATNPGRLGLLTADAVASLARSSPGATTRRLSFAGGRPRRPGGAGASSANITTETLLLMKMDDLCADAVSMTSWRWKLVLVTMAVVDVLHMPARAQLMA